MKSEQQQTPSTVREEEACVKGQKGTFWGDGNISYLYCGISDTLGIFVKTHESLRFLSDCTVLTQSGVERQRIAMLSLPNRNSDLIFCLKPWDCFHPLNLRAPDRTQLLSLIWKSCPDSRWLWIPGLQTSLQVPKPCHCQQHSFPLDPKNSFFKFFCLVWFWEYTWLCSGITPDEVWVIRCSAWNQTRSTARKAQKRLGWGGTVAALTPKNQQLKVQSRLLIDNNWTKK